MPKETVVVQKSILDNYINLSLQNKINSVTKSKVPTTPTKPKRGILESSIETIVEIKVVTGLVFPNKALNHSLFEQLLPMMEEASKVEQSSLDEKARKKHAMHNAAVLAVLFNDYKEALSYLKNYEQGYTGKQLLHDACLITLPANEKWNVPIWKALIQKYINKPNLFNIFQNASAIEDYIESNRKKLEEENNKTIEERYASIFGAEYEELQKKIGQKTQIKEVQQDFKAYLTKQLGFPERGKPTEAQKATLEQRLKSPTVEDEKQCEKLIQHHLEQWRSKYKGIDTSTKVGFIKAMLDTNKAKIDSLKTFENKDLFSKATSFDRLNSYQGLIVYKNYNKNIQAAKLFTDLKIQEAGFDEYLSLKPKDNLTYIPDVSVDGEALGYKGYVLKKLNPSDPRAAVLGKLTGCCQSLTDTGADCAIHGITDDRGGFYVLFEIDPKTKKEQIVAQCWAWRGKNNSIVFDSVESNFNFRERKGSLELITDFYSHLADKLVQEKEVPNVMVGFGGATPAALKVLPTIPHADYPVDYDGYRDSNEQGFLAIQGLSLCTLFSGKKIKPTSLQPQANTENIVHEPKSLPLSAKNRLIYVISTQNIDVKKFEFCGLTSEVVKVWNIEYANIIKRLKSDNKETVQEAFIRYKQHLGFDDKTIMHRIDKELASKIDEDDDQSLGDFIRIIIADEKNGSLINSITGLKSILRFVFGECCGLKLIRELLGDKKLQGIINCVADLNSLCDEISSVSDKIIPFIKEVLGKEKVKSIIHSIADLQLLLNIIPEDKRIDFVKEVIGNEKLKSIVHSVYDLIRLKSIPIDKRIDFIKEVFGNEQLKSIFHSTINSMWDMKWLLNYLSETYHTIEGVVDFIKVVDGCEKFRSITHSVNDLLEMLHHIPHNKMVSFFKEVVGNVKVQSIIHSWKELETLFYSIPGDIKVTFIKDVLGYEKLQLIINSRDAWFSLMYSIPQNERAIFLKDILADIKLKPIIHSMDELGVILYYINDGICTDAYADRAAFIKNVFGEMRLKALINSEADLKILSAYLPTDTKFDFIREVLGDDKLQSIFDSVSDWQTLLDRDENTENVKFQSIINYEVDRAILTGHIPSYEREYCIKALFENIKKSVIAVITDDSIKVVDVHPIQQLENEKVNQNSLDHLTINKSKLIEAANHIKKEIKIQIELARQKRVIINNATVGINAIQVDFSSAITIEAVNTIAMGLKQQVTTLSKSGGLIGNEITERIELLKYAVTQKQKEINLMQETLQQRLNVLKGFNFDIHLNIFEQKMIEMMEKSNHDSNYFWAAQNAKILCTKLKEEKYTFLHTNCDIELVKVNFKYNCIKHIKDARTVLDHHREWAGAFVKFLADIVAWFSQTLGYKLGFFGKTDSSVKLDQLEMDLREQNRI